MRRIIQVVFFFLVGNTTFLTFGGETSFFDEPIYERKPNDYVFYYDERDSSPVLVGIQYLDADNYRIRYYEYSNNRNIELHLSVSVTSENISISDFVTDEDLSLDSMYEITKLFTTLINLDDRVDKSVFPGEPSFTQNYEYKGIKYSHEIEYRFWVPIFQMYHISQIEPEIRQVSLVHFGRPTVSGNSFFDDFVYLPNEIETELIDIEEGRSQTLKYGDIAITIDSNWVQGNDGIIKLPLRSEHDAAISLMNMRSGGQLENSGLHIAYLRMSSQKNFIPASSAKVIRFNDRTVLEYDVFDTQTQRYSSVVEMYFEKGKLLYIVTVSAFRSLMDANYEYFNNLLTSIKLES